MKALTVIAVIGSLIFSLAGNSASAQTNNPTTPVIVEKGKIPVPADLQALVKKFEAERGAYLTEQKALLAKLKDATTADQRAAIRASLQDDRADFLADLKQFRQDLKQELSELKGKLNNQELARLIAEVKQEVAEHNHHAK